MDVLFFIHTAKKHPYVHNPHTYKRQTYVVKFKNKNVNLSIAIYYFEPKVLIGLICIYMGYGLYRLL